MSYELPVPAARFSAEGHQTRDKQLRKIHPPPKGPRVPPECWNLHPFAHCCALLASSSLHVRAVAPCCARIVLWAVRYAWISLSDVAPLSEELPLSDEVPLSDAWVVGAACAVVVWVVAGASVVALALVVAGSVVVVGSGSGVVVVAGAGAGTVVDSFSGVVVVSGVSVVEGGAGALLVVGAGFDEEDTGANTTEIVEDVWASEELVVRGMEVDDESVTIKAVLEVGVATAMLDSDTLGNTDGVFSAF